MHPFGTYSVIPRLPQQLEGLWELAYNFHFAWNPQIKELFVRMDPARWAESRGNPVRFLNMLPQALLDDLARDELFLGSLKEALQGLQGYLSRKGQIKLTTSEGENRPVIAYFSFEYGIDVGLPIYSGGLGILAGDHLKSASDLGLPLVGVGLAYNQGYFRQYLTPDGWQQERYPEADFEQMPMTLVSGDNGEPVMVSVEVLGQELKAQIWEVLVGRVRLFLLDTDIKDNPQHFRDVTDRLYGGNLEMRVMQEILLGIGGIRALWAMGLAPKVIHMNEGHSAFAGLERIRVLMHDHGLSFEAAQEVVASSSVFTTHTPVPAGNDRFPPDMMHKYFESYARQLGLAFKVFMAFGREDPRNDAEDFCMTVLALRLSRFNNGVSLLHGRVSRNMWKKVWDQFPVEDVPIGAITNGVHIPTWVAPDMALLLDRYLGPNWREDPDTRKVWRQAEAVPDAELWRTHERLRERLIDYARFRLREQLKAKGARRKEIEGADEVLDPRALTICFARRFATYKRANLLLSDMERLRKLMFNDSRPIQFIFAGKAHPADNEGKKIIQQLIGLARTPEFRNRFVFLEDYDMVLAKHMVQGGDVWLNNPRRPLEACGTSGMKAMVNGVINFSTLDGWWDEAWLPDNSVGFAIGKGEEYEDLAYQDFVESQTLFNILENDVVPDFYERGQGSIPRSWVSRMRKALTELGPVYNSHRMVEDYALKGYEPAGSNYDTLVAGDFTAAKELAAWRMDLMTKWHDIAIREVRATKTRQVFVDQAIEVEVEVFLGGLEPTDLTVEAYCGPLTKDGRFASRWTSRLEHASALEQGWHLFKGSTSSGQAGTFGYTVRILPHHPLLLDPHSLGLIHWV
jgi:starch phosphorylase